MRMHFSNSSEKITLPARQRKNRPRSGNRTKSRSSLPFSLCIENYSDILQCLLHSQHTNNAQSREIFGIYPKVKTLVE